MIHTFNVLRFCEDVTVMSPSLIFFFVKNKMIFIHSTQNITPFNTAKNVKDEFVNKLTSSKLITYNGIMPTKIYDKIKVTGIFMPPDLQR